MNISVQGIPDENSRLPLTGSFDGTFSHFKNPYMPSVEIVPVDLVVHVVRLKTLTVPSQTITFIVNFTVLF